MEPTERCGGSGGSEAIDGHIEGDRPGSLDGTEQKRDEEEEVYTTTSSRHVNTLKKNGQYTTGDLSIKSNRQRHHSLVFHIQLKTL